VARGGDVLALDLGAVGDGALERVAVDELDGERRAVKRLDHAGLLVLVVDAVVVGVVVAVLDAVVVAVGIARVRPVVELAEVAHTVAVGVALGHVDVVPVLPAVWHAVVVAVLGARRRGDGEKGKEDEEGESSHAALKTASVATSRRSDGSGALPLDLDELRSSAAW
jgi:hypothetical protein